MAALRRPAGPAYSLLRERPGGSVVVGIYRICTPGPPYLYPNFSFTI